MARVSATSLLVLCTFVFVNAQLLSGVKEGDVCLKYRDWPEWTCKVLNGCPMAKNLVEQKKVLPALDVCGFNTAAEPLFCCPPSDVTDLPGDIFINFTGAVHKPTKMSKADLKCQEYQKLYLPTSDSVSNTSQPGNGSNVGSYCSYGRVVATPREFPHMVLLGYGKPPEFICPGSLISERFVLSSAHCINHLTRGRVSTVMVGAFDSGLEADKKRQWQIFDVHRRILHNSYRENGSLYNDIMLLELNRDVKFNDHIRPICLHTSYELPPGKAVLSGWGLTAQSWDRVLEKNEVEVVDMQKCNDAQAAAVGSHRLIAGFLQDIQICAGTEDSDSCQGDVGGPLQVPLENGLYTQVGIMSFGTEYPPSVYTRISPYIPWIEKIVWPDIKT